MAEGVCSSVVLFPAADEFDQQSARSAMMYGLESEVLGKRQGER